MAFKTVNQDGTGILDDKTVIFRSITSTSVRGNALKQTTSSLSTGYTSGGQYVNIIDKFPFSVDENATDVGDLTQSRGYATGQSSSTHGYTSAGRNPSMVNTIDKFPFSSDANATDVGDAYFSVGTSAGQSSETDG